MEMTPSLGISISENAGKGPAVSGGRMQNPWWFVCMVPKLGVLRTHAWPWHIAAMESSKPMVGTLTHMLSLHSLCGFVREGKGGVKTNAWL